MCPGVCPSCRWVRLGSYGSSGCALGVVEVRLVRQGVPSWSLGLFGFVWFVRVHPGGHWVYSGSLVHPVRPRGLCVYSRSSRSSGFALGVTVFVRVRQDRACWSLGSFWFVWFARLCFGLTRFRSGSSGAL